MVAQRMRRKKWVAVVLVVGIGCSILLLRGCPAAKIAYEEAPTVATAPVRRESLHSFLTVSAEFLPYQAIKVHAKVSGYVQTINVDIGDHVKAGQVLAVLEVPELQNDVERADAALQAAGREVRRADADYREAHLASMRLAMVARRNAKFVAQQDLDAAKAKDEAMRSALESNQQVVAEKQAEVDKMRAMLAYATITAPFDGVITKRYADTGALIQAGISSNTQAMPLVDLAEDGRLRLAFPIPESTVGKIHAGKPVEVSVQSLGDVFHGVIARYSRRVDFSTRTMQVEVDVPNEKGIFTPGMYASARIALEEKNAVLCVPLQALNAGTPAMVMVLNPAQTLEERNVVVGMRTATKAEITSGLHEGELVVIGDRSSLRGGQKATGKIVNLEEK